MQCDGIYKRDMERGHPAQTVTQSLEVNTAEDKTGVLLCHVKGFRIYLESSEEPLNTLKQEWHDHIFILGKSLRWLCAN